MELDNRVGRLAAGNKSTARYVAIALLAGVLAACTPANTETAEPSETTGEKSAERIAILITLDVSQEKGSMNPDPKDLSETRTAIVNRLKEIIPAAAQDSVRTFENLPAIAVSVDPALIATILEWPETKTIELDRTFDLKDSTFK